MYPSLPPLEAYPPNVNIGAGVENLDAERLDSSSFGAVHAEGRETLLDTNLEPFESGGAATLVALGGMYPRLEASGTAFGFHAVTASGTVSYSFMVLPLDPEAFPAPGPVPVLLSASGGGSFGIGSPYADASIQGEVRVEGATVGFYAWTVRDGAPSSEVNTFPAVYPVTVSSYDRNVVVLTLLSGLEHNSTTGSSSYQVYVDPGIHVDPAATFEHDGETLRYVEHFGIAYSPGVEQSQEVVVFRDGFESGALGEWSAKTP